jgi:hypothetical protein
VPLGRSQVRFMFYVERFQSMCKLDRIMALLNVIRSLSQLAQSVQRDLLSANCVLEMRKGRLIIEHCPM